MKEPRLITIPVSHYCEKARWGLERAGVDYEEERHLQLFHAIATLRAGAGDEVPVLIADGRTITDSTSILQWADARKLGSLYPTDPAARAEVEALEDELDEGLGVDARLWMYTYVLNLPQIIGRYSGKYGVPSYERIILPRIMPLIRGRIARILDMRPDSRERSRESLQRIFDGIADRIADGRRFLCADRFTAADLTFAALSAAVLLPPQYGVALPQPEEFPREMAEQIRKWRAHPAGVFADRLFREERRRSPTPKPA